MNQKKHNRLVFVYIILFALMSLLPFNIIAQETDPSNLVGFVATNSAVNVRDRPSPNAAVISTLPPNMSVSILAESEDDAWFQVELPDGKQGWVSASLLRVVESAIPADLVPITPENASQLVEITELASTLSTGFAFSPDGRLLASYSWLGDIEIYDVRTKIRIATLTDENQIVTRVAFSPDGSQLAASSYSGAVKIWYTQSWAERTSFQGHSSGADGVAFSPDGELLASVGGNDLLILWNVRTGERVHEIDVRTDQVRDLIFSPDGTMLATAGEYTDSFVRLWDVATGEQLWSKYISGSVRLAFSPDGETLIVLGGGPNLTMTGYDVQTTSPTFVFTSLGGAPASFAINSSGTLLAAGGSFRRTFILADVENKKVLFTHSSQEDGNNASIMLTFSPDGRLVITSDVDSVIRIWGVHGSD